MAIESIEVNFIDLKIVVDVNIPADADMWEKKRIALAKAKEIIAESTPFSTTYITRKDEEDSKKIYRVIDEVDDLFAVIETMPYDPDLYIDLILWWDKDNCEAVTLDFNVEGGVKVMNK